MRITTLIENRPSDTDARLAAEWGLSLHISCSCRNILFDTGASGAFAGNAGHLGIDIASVDAAILSHHHYDHGGGLRRFLELNTTATVYRGPAPRGECCGKIFGCFKKPVGLDKQLVHQYPDRFTTLRAPAEILPGVFLFPHILQNRPRPAGNKHLFVETDQAFTSDDFAHEIIMVIRENGRLIIFTGCAHNGILNMVDTVAAAFKGDPIKAVVGGFHLMALPRFNIMAESKHDVETLARSLLEYPVESVYTGHCTGGKAFRILKAVMGNGISDIRTGSCFEI
jgi:7,8-dihydropterin-6-yl-methyl-4-(beta-D-ribofuranosyl)aminobenzene 5'-phosphate synthase